MLRNRQVFQSDMAGRNLISASAHNRRVVLDCIRLYGPLSRKDISAHTKLAAQTVSNIVNEMLASGLVVKEPALRGHRGPPAHPVALNPAGAFSIGLVIHRQEIQGCVADLSGRRVAFAEYEHGSNELKPRRALEVIRGIIRDLRTDSMVEADRLLGIGLAVSGPLGVQSNLAMGPTSAPDWFDESLLHALSAAEKLNVFVSNDTTASTISQRLYGPAQKLQSFVHLFLGYGVGSGMFLDGRLYDGVMGNAGELGHIVVFPDGHPCFCGNAGCLEQYLSLMSAFRACGLTGSFRENVQALSAQLQEQRPTAIAWLDTAGEAFRRAVHVVEQILEPSSIVVGGVMPLPIIDAIIERARPFMPSVRQANFSAPRISIGATGWDAEVIAAAALPVFSEFSPVAVP